MNLNTLAHPWKANQVSSNVNPLRPNAHFIYMHHPKNWSVAYFDKTIGKKSVKTALLLPELNPMYCQGGVNLIRTSGGQIDTMLSYAKMREEGFTILEPHKHDYLKVYPCKGGTHTADRWTNYEFIGKSVLSEHDSEGYNEWRRQLILSGAISLPHKHFVRLMLVDMGRQYDKHSKAQHLPQAKEKMKTAQQLIDDVKEFLNLLSKQGKQVYEL
jgi:hypothetical protein